MTDLRKLFVTELSDILDAENQLIKALPKMAQAAHSGQLRDAFNRHLEQTKAQAMRVEEAFRSIGEEPRRRTCQAMEGLIDEAQLIATEFEKNNGLDAGLIAAAQKVEHYEIASYGTLSTWAQLLEYSNAVLLLKDNLREEKETDVLLNEQAKHYNPAALASDTEKRGETVSAFKKTVTSGT